MDYPLENLGPEKFQQLCQALLVKEYPSTQCFPVAQPDGGRDAVSYFVGEGSATFAVYQVKFSRKPLAETDPHRWLTAIMEAEAPKIKALVPRGATKFFLITNIPGTAHLDAGSIDRLNAALSDQLGIPALCWWRDDVNRRLDNAWSLKWAYPEVMSGPDFLRAIIESGLTEERERRASTIRAFLRHQFDSDEEVRFKQVELQNKLLDLFIDVPAAPREPLWEKRQTRIYYHLARLVSAGYAESEEADLPASAADDALRWQAHPERNVGAASLLLNSTFQARMPRIVLEGAPGQGKSTVGQYVCQVHRMKLLSEEEALADIPTPHQAAPAKLPIRVDLRDLATWLARKDPFSVEAQAPGNNWRKSLESFLAALISYEAGGSEFDADDLIATCRISSVVLVFDGLDEIAEIGAREEVVTELVRGVQRLQENCAALQTIVTSRPASFANSPGMPERKYAYLQLLSLTPELVTTYSEKWLKARRVEPKMAAEFRQVLKTKLGQPHLRDLARNPMQLAILLSLILKRGASLPDKRTALYDYYIDLFLSRESEKSEVVRDHRDLLIEIHRYLGWLLHSEAEKGEVRPSISQDRLLRVVSEYLAFEGYETSLADLLFTGMIDRVVALVSRVEGTFEFEVQPLREYFAAGFLFHTAPPSSPGKERSGSRPERFEAIARNFYWLNVTRFFAGSSSKGELPSLVERLQFLCSEPGYRYISEHPALAATLLSDYVFSQNPRSIKQVVGLVVDGVGLRRLAARTVAGRRRSSQGYLFALPEQCGRQDLVTRCFQLLEDNPPADYAAEILDVISANSSTGELMSRWLELYTRHEATHKVQWLEHALKLGVLSTIPLETLESILPVASLDTASLSVLYRARRLDYLEKSEDTFNAIVEGILDRRILPQPQRRVESALDALGHALDASRYALSFRERQPVPLTALLEHRNRPTRITWSANLSTSTESFAAHRKCVELALLSEDEGQKTAAEWATELAPWERVVESGLAVWGERRALQVLAVTSAAIRSRGDKAADSPDLFDPSMPLCRRVRHARVRSGVASYWANQLRRASTAEQLEFVCLVTATWANVNTLTSIAKPFSAALDALSERAWRWVFHSSRRCRALADPHGEVRADAFQTSDLPADLGLRAACVIASRAAGIIAEEMYDRHLAQATHGDSIILEFAMKRALDASRFGREDWSPNLDLIKLCYTNGHFGESGSFLRATSEQIASIPLDIAEAIASEPTKYPSGLLRVAEERWRGQVAASIVPVADVAEKQEWFSVTA